MPKDDLHKLLVTILSAPSLEVITTTCVHSMACIYDTNELRWDPGEFGELLGAPTLQVPSLPGHTFTELRELRLHWDGLSLLWINALLHLPRRLEVLHLQMNGKRHAHHPVLESMPLNSAIRPVANSLRELAIHP